MTIHVRSASLYGAEAHALDVSVTLVPEITRDCSLAFSIAGLSDAGARETRQRVASAIATTTCAPASSRVRVDLCTSDPVSPVSGHHGAIQASLGITCLPKCASAVRSSARRDVSRRVARQLGMKSQSGTSANPS